MGRIQFWLSNETGSERLQLPVNPPSVSVSSPFGFEDVEVSQLGELTIIKERGLREITLSSFFPKEYNSSFCEYTDIPDPEEAIALIEKWRDERKPVRLNITGVNFNYAMTIRDFTYEKEKAGSPYDVYYEMTLKEYRHVVLRQVQDPQVSTQAKMVAPPVPQRPGTPPSPSSYTVKKGDSLYAIAKRVYGNGSMYSKIYEANKSIIGKNPNLIYAGQVLVIPK